MNTRNINLKTAAQETSPSCFEPKAEKVIAFHGKGASWRLQRAGRSESRRCCSAYQIDIDISKAQAPEARTGCSRTKQNS